MAHVCCWNLRFSGQINPKKMMSVNKLQAVSFHGCVFHNGVTGVHWFKYRNENNSNGTGSKVKEYWQCTKVTCFWQVSFLHLVHRISPVFIAEMVQDSIRKNAAHFMTLMPMFAQRLAQRDYDFILVPPHKKRLLLKMYIVGEQEKLQIICME